MITGITDEMLVGKPQWKEVEKKVMGFIGDYNLVAHNAPFD